MSWSIGYDKDWGRDIGYGVPAWCDHPGCMTEIDRGLAHVCGGEPYGGEHGCGLYFCDAHHVGEHSLCRKCELQLPPFDPKPEHPKWLHHKLHDPSWERWRKDNPEEVGGMKAIINNKNLGGASLNKNSA